MIPRILPRQRNLRNSSDLYLAMGCNSIAHYTEWGSTNCNDRGEYLLEFLNSSNLEILNQGNESTFLSGSKLEVPWASRQHYKLGGFFRVLPVRSQTFCSLYRAPYQ